MEILIDVFFDLKWWVYPLVIVMILIVICALYCIGSLANEAIEDQKKL